MTRYQGESGQWDELRNCFPERMVCTVALKTKKGALCRPVQRLHHLEASNQSPSAECYDRDVHGGESKNKKVKESTKKKRFSRVVESKCNSPTTLERWGGCSGPNPQWKGRKSP